MPSIEKEPIYDVYCTSRRQYQRYLNILFWGCLSGAVSNVDVWLGGLAMDVGSNRARGKIFTVSIGSVGSLYLSVYVYICVCKLALLTSIHKSPVQGIFHGNIKTAVAVTEYDTVGHNKTNTALLQIKTE